MKKIIEKIIQWLSQWNKDKVLHLLLTMLVALTAASISNVCGGNGVQNCAAAFFAGFVAGVAKEIYDEWRTGGSEESDWAADVVGIVIALVYVITLNVV